MRLKLLTSIERILLWFARIVRYLQSCPSLAHVLEEIDVRPFIKSMVWRIRGWCTIEVVDVRKSVPNQSFVQLPVVEESYSVTAKSSPGLAAMADLRV